jgi:phosphate/phosphite/phosphonate ABC transporter binding protein
MRLRHGFGILSAGLLLLSLAAGCEQKKQKVEILPTPVDGRKTVRVVASDEAITTFRKLAEEFATRSGLVFDIVQMQSSDIPGIIRKGAADIGITARKLNPSKMSDLNYVPFAWDGAVFAAGSDAGVKALSSAQVFDIYAGKVTNWKQVGGRDLAIRIVDRPQYSSMRIAAESIVGKTLPLNQGALVIEASDAVLHAVRTIPGAFACLAVSRTLIEKFPVVPLEIDGRPPVLTVEKKGNYPASMEYGMMFRKDAPTGVKELANFLVSVDGIHQIASFALVAASGNMPIASCHCRETEGDVSPSKRTPLSGTFTIGVTPELGAIAQEKRYMGISQAIAEQLDVATRVKHLMSYDEVVHAFSEGRIDAAFVGSLAYARLKTQFGVIPIARPEVKGVSWYKGLIIVRADGAFRRFADLRGKRFAYVSDTSAGDLFMRDLVARANGASPGAFFSQLVKARSHADAIQLVIDGKVDGAAVKDLVLRRVEKSEPAISKQLRELEHSPTFPENALVVAPAIGDRQTRKLREVLLKLQDGAPGQDALKALGADRFVPTSDTDYASVFLLARTTGYPLGVR